MTTSMKLGILFAIVALSAATGCAAESSGPESDVSEGTITADEGKHAAAVVQPEETQETTHKSEGVPVLGESPVPHRPDPAVQPMISQPTVLPAPSFFAAQ
jgi:hypothetical protein